MITKCVNADVLYDTPRDSKMKNITNALNCAFVVERNNNGLVKTAFETWSTDPQYETLSAGYPKHQLYSRLCIHHSSAYHVSTAIYICVSSFGSSPDRK